MANRGTQVVVTIKDDGIGMDMRQQKELFTRFYRAKNSAANIPGLGLGLYLSKQIVAEHGRKLTCNSVLGKGSAFTVSLPKDR